MKKVALVLALVFLALNASQAIAFGLSPDDIRKAMAKALHSEDPAVKKAAQVIQAKGLLKPGVGFQQVMAALKDPEVKKAVILLQKKGILPNMPLPKSPK